MEHGFQKEKARYGEDNSGLGLVILQRRLFKVVATLAEASEKTAGDEINLLMVLTSASHSSLSTDRHRHL